LISSIRAPDLSTVSLAAAQRSRDQTLVGDPFSNVPAGYFFNPLAVPLGRL